VSQAVIDLLLDNPLILLFTVIAVGYPLGRIRIAGISNRHRTQDNPRTGRAGTHALIPALPSAKIQI
jgi:hypothetical protein